MMKTYEADVAIVGGGSAGLAAAIVIKKAGLDALIIERDRELGGIKRYAPLPYFATLYPGPTCLSVGPAVAPILPLPKKSRELYVGLPTITIVLLTNSVFVNVGF